jgi:hypothetical protein
MDTTTSSSSDNKTSFKYGKLVLMFSTNYFENHLLPNDLISVRNHGDDEEDERDIKRVLERQGDAHIQLEIQYNSEFQSLTLSPIRSPGPAQLQIDVHDTYEIGFGCSIYAQKDDEIYFPMALVPGPIKIGSTRIAETSSISIVQLVQKLSTLKLMPKSHMKSNWGILRLLGRIMR